MIYFGQIGGRVTRPRFSPLSPLHSSRRIGYDRASCPPHRNRQNRESDRCWSPSDPSLSSWSSRSSFPIVPLILSSFIHPKNPNRVKLQPYESGVETIGPTHIQFRTRYYLYALIFVIFDVEVMYLFPWGVAFNSLGVASLVKMVIFIAFLLVGLAYAWKKGALSWE